MCTNAISITSAKSRKNDVVTIPVPCGKCYECKKAKLSAWLFRFEVELRSASNPLFVTLTYDDNSVPYGKDAYSDIDTRKVYGYKSLNPRDVQLFMKKLRKAHAKVSNKKLVFMAVGEYGSRTLRPHYHLILLNLTDQKLITKAWAHGFDYVLPLGWGTAVCDEVHPEAPKSASGMLENVLKMFERHWPIISNEGTSAVPFAVPTFVLSSFGLWREDSANQVLQGALIYDGTAPPKR